jgi:hypothetical protein
MILSLYDFGVRMSYAFHSESYIINNIKDNNIKLIKREGIQFINDEGEVIGVHDILSNEANTLKKPPMFDNSCKIKFNYSQREMMLKQ